MAGQENSLGFKVHEIVNGADVTTWDLAWWVTYHSPGVLLKFDCGLGFKELPHGTMARFNFLSRRLLNPR